jgi:uncharacterized Tic20 family protein
MTNSERNFATATHLSALSQYFIPFGNFILPIVIWSSKKEQSSFVNENGKQIINFQLSLLVYSLTLLFVSVPLIAYNFFNKVPLNQWDSFDLNFHSLNWSDFTFSLSVGVIAFLLFGFMKITEFVLIVLAAVSTTNNKTYKYPLTIPFLK